MSAIPSGDERASDDRYGVLFENARDGVWIAGADGRIIRANPALLDLLGYAREEIVGRPEADLFADPEPWRELRREIERSGSVRDVRLRLRRRDGTDAGCLLRAVAERDASGGVQATQVVVHDITHLALVEERRTRDGLHDTLTHLPNRRAFLARVGRLLERAAFRPGWGFALLYVDLDRFKRVNASLGHAAGDDLLVMVGERLDELVRPEDIVGRLGGDEYGILMAGVDDLAEAEAAAMRVQAGLIRPFHLRDSEVCVGASVGIVLADRGYRDAEDVLRDAHTAAHAAKSDGAGGRVTFEGAMRERAATSLATEAALRRALEREELLLHYQPVVSMASGRILGFEALVRWRHPERGLLPPAEFLPAAEESGLIVPIGDWVLREACGTMAGWRRDLAADESGPILSVNLSGRQLVVPGLAARVSDVLEACGLPASALWLEISESTFLKRSEALLRNLDGLAALGVTLCLDDFGTVYSTLAWLQDLPVHTLKVDRTFVGQLERSGGTRIVETILSLARDLGLRAVAEGVETEAQRDGLLRLGCEDAQGFLFSHPVEAVRAAALVLAERSRV